MRTVRLRVTLREVSPRVVRLIDVPASTTLPELHELLQAALGWTDSHLHQFVVGDTRYGTPDLDNDLDELDETSFRLADLPDRFAYLYDFGDGWEHDVERLGAGADQPGCVDGEGACPPEDCGGAPGYTDLLKVLADPAHPEHLHMKEWTGDQLVPFDRDAVDVQVRRVVGVVPGSVRLVLDLASDGVKITPGGRLPRAFVRALQEQRPLWHPLDRPASSEDDLPPLGALHDLLRQVGLLRLSNGILAPTKAAGDDLSVVRRLRSWFTPGGFTMMAATSAIAVLAAHGPKALDELTDEVVPLLGHGWGRNGQPLTVADVKSTINRLANVLSALDQIETDWPTWRAGPAALSLLPRATGLAPLL